MADLVRRTLDPAKPVGLTTTELEIARLTVHGRITEAMAIEGNTNAGRPLTLEDAAKTVGYRLKRARTYLDLLPEFQAERARLLKARRQSEEARNLSTLIEIRDDRGENLAADRTVRIKAVAAIEGTDKGGGVVVNVNQTSNVANITPGYVIKLGKFREPESLPTAVGKLSGRLLILPGQNQEREIRLIEHVFKMISG
jgi:hypothetical protein